jgi:hypothetical protein
MSEIKEFYKGYKYEMPSELFDIPIVTEEFEFTVPADDFIIGEDEKLILDNLLLFFVKTLKDVPQTTVDFKRSDDMNTIERFIVPYLNQMIDELEFPDTLGKFIFYNPGVALALLTFGVSQFEVAMNDAKEKSSKKRK